jgi:DNA-binding NtrC family response regulator
MARISVIDDSAEFLQLMQELLAADGHQVTAFPTVEASIESVVASNPDLLFVDLRLRGGPLTVSGWELVVLARSHRHLMSTPVILCSADSWALKERAADLEQLDGVYVRPKPFEIDEMSELVERALARRPDSQHASRDDARARTPAA